LTLTIALAAVAACQPAAPPASAAPDYAAMFDPAIEQVTAMWNTRNYAVLDSVMAPDFKRVAPDFTAASLAEYKEALKKVHEVYPDFHIVFDERGYSANRVFTRWTATATYTAPGAAKGAGKPVKVVGMTIFTFRDGRIIEEEAVYDLAGLEAQTGTAKVPHGRQ
jgi:predicted ester cyclase